MMYPEDEKKQESPSSPGSDDSSSKLEDEKKEELQVKPDEKVVRKARTRVSGEGKKKKASAGSTQKTERETSDKAKKEPKKAAEKEAKPAREKKGKTKTSGEKLPADYVPRKLAGYRDKIVTELMKRFNYKNAMMVPRLEKIVLNVGVGDASQNPKLLEAASNEIAAVTGQKPAITRARLSISNFKLRAGMAIGCRVTLRRWQMWEFLDRLLNIAIPRIRDFRGLSDRSFDGRGNYSMGIKEQIIFPEIDIDKIERVHGLDITFVTTASTDEEAHALLSELGVPFRRRPAQTSEQVA